MFRHYGGTLRLPKELQSLPKSIKIASLIIFVYSMGWSIAKPFLPIYFNQILGNYSAVGFVIGLPLILSMFWNLVFGDLLDKFSKKKTISLILLLYIPVGPWLLSLRNLFDFIIFRFYHSIIRSGMWTSMKTYVREHSPPKKASESFGLFDTFYILSLTIGPLLGGFLIFWFGFSIFLSISIFAVLGFFTSLFLADKNKGTLSDGIRYMIKDRFISKSFSDFKKIKELRPLLILKLFVAFCSSSITMVLPLILDKFGINFILIGLIFSLLCLSGVFEFYFSILADKTDRKLIIYKGTFFGALFFFLLFFFMENVLLLFVFSFFFSVSMSAVIPALEGSLTDLIPKKECGELTGVFESIYTCGVGIGPVIAGIIADLFGLRYVFLLGFFILISLSIFVYFVDFD